MGNRSSLLTCILTIAIGIVLIIAHKTIASTGIIIAASIIFLLAGLINLVFYSSRGNIYDSNGRRIASRRSGSAATFSIISSIAAMVLGLCMLIFQNTFAILIPFIFGCIIAIGALSQIYYLAIGVRPFSLTPWLYIVPLLLIAGAVYVFMQSTPKDDPMIILVSGISFALFGLGCCIEGLLVYYLARKSNSTTQHLPQITENE